MIVKADDGVRKSFLGVDFVVLSHGPKTMVTKMLYKAGDNPPFHKHPHEQSGYVLSGKYRIKCEEETEIITAGDAYSIPGNTEHTVEVLEPGEVLDFFSPPREDYF